MFLWFVCLKKENVLEKGRLQYYLVWKEGKVEKAEDKKMTQKTTCEIRTLLKSAKLDFDEVENRALNDYLSKILHSCPITEDVCTTNQCAECSVFKKTFK